MALVPPGPISQFVSKLGAGQALAADDVEGISRHLGRWYEAFKVGGLERPRVHIPESYTRQYQAGQLAELLTKVKESRA